MELVQVSATPTHDWTLRRVQLKSDHRLRELVRLTGDVGYAIQRGISRSTARGWLRSTPTEEVSLNVVDMDRLRLQQEVLKLRARLGWVIAILRLFVVVLKTTDVSLIRFPQGTAKRMLLRTIERSSCVLPLKVALRVIGLSHSRYHALKQEEECGLDDLPSCPRRLSQQLRHAESNDPHFPIPALQTSSGENSRRNVQNVVTQSTADYLRRPLPTFWSDFGRSVQRAANPRRCRHRRQECRSPSWGWAV